MFEHDYEIYGLHATYLKHLVNNLQIFERYIDVYMTAAVVGALNNRKKTIEVESTDRARIYAEQFNTEHVRCNEIFKTIILADKSMHWPNEEKINICFRYRDKKDDMALNKVSDEEIEKMKEAKVLFNDYVLGGIEILYETFANKTDTSTVEIVDTVYKAIFDHHNFIESMECEESEDNLFRPEY